MFHRIQGLMLLGSVCLSAAAQRFQQPVTVSTGNWPAAIITADVNGDGRPDLIYTDHGATASSSTTHVLLGNGDGTFAQGAAIATAGTTIAAADVDRDGRVDLLWISQAQSAVDAQIYLARGKGDGSFADAAVLGTLRSSGGLAPVFKYLHAIDIRHGADLDLVVEDVANGSLFTLSPEASAAAPIPATSVNLPDGTGPLLTGDLNGDGSMDIVVGSTGTGAADVFLGSPKGLQFAARYLAPNGLRSLLLHDMDGDGHPDLLVENSNGRVDVLHGNPDGSFATTFSGGSDHAGHLMAVSDATGGSRHNILTASAAGVSVLIDNGQMSFTQGGGYNAGPGGSATAVADFNGDGVTDLAIDAPEGIAILLGNAAGSMGSSRTYGSDSASSGLATIAGEKSTDAVLGTGSTSNVKVFRGTGDGTFTAPAAGVTQATDQASKGHSRLATGDFNGDGIPDLLLASDAGVSVRYGTGGGNFAAASNPVFPGSVSSAVADFEGTGRSGVVTSDATGLHVLVSDLREIFSDRAAEGVAGIVAAGDLNGDGRADLVYQDGTRWRTLLNGGSANPFQAGIDLTKPEGLDGLTPAAAGIADLDGDGKADVVAVYDRTSANRAEVDRANPTAGKGNVLAVWYGKGDGTFEAPAISNLSRNFNQLTLADVNADGHADVLLSDGYVLSTQMSSRARTPGTESHLLAGREINGIAAADVNGDGRVDLLVSNGSATSGVTAKVAGSTASSEINGAMTVLLGERTPVHAQAQGATNLVLTISTPTIYYGQASGGNLTPTYQDVGTPPTGTFSFLSDGVPFCSFAVTAAGCPVGNTILPAGTHIITATYSGDNNYAPSTSNPVTIVVLKDLTAGILVTSLNPSVQGQDVTFGTQITGNVTYPDGSAAIPDGSVNFLDGTTVLATVPLSASGGAVYTTSQLAIGSHAITVVYPGTANFNGLTSTVLTQVVNPPVVPPPPPPPPPPPGTPTYTIDVGAIAVRTGGIGSSLVKVTPVNGFADQVLLTCGNLPPGADCSFGTVVIPPGGGSTTLQINTAAKSPCPYDTVGTEISLNMLLPLGGTALAGFLVMFVPRRRRTLLPKLLVLVLSAYGLAALSGCGTSCIQLGVAPGTYTIQVIGRSSATPPLVVTQPATLTVTK